MITSITIKNRDENPKTITGSILLDSGPYMQVKESKGSVYIGTTGLDGINDGTPISCPYVATVSGASPDGFGNVFVLGGSTSQVDYFPTKEGETIQGIALCDMSQRNDSPIIFRAIYDMLRILRRWLDAHKDSLLLSDAPGDKQWKNMLAYDHDSDYYSKSESTAPDFPIFREVPPDYSSSTTDTSNTYTDTRLRSEITSIGPSLRLYNEYQSVVALWNRIVKDPESVVEIRIHPGDNAGIYVGVTSNIPLQHVSPDSTVTITSKITVSFTGQTGDNLRVWNRVMPSYCRVYPKNSNNISTIDYPGVLVAGSTAGAQSSKLDKDGQVTDKTSDLVATYTETIAGTGANPLATTYTAQMLYEVIPFCLCKGETSYADSLFGLHYTQHDTNAWTINVSVSYQVDNEDSSEILNKTYYRSTIYAEVCSDPYPDKIPDDADNGDEETENAQ